MHPVVADPKVSFGRFIYVKWSKSEVRTIGSKAITSKAAFITAVCWKIPHAEAKAACVLAGGTIIKSVMDTFKSGRQRGRCVETKYLYYPPQMVGWKVVGC